ncbi:hypothetical protein R1sor_007186 [Riccia sorocarpa]|uniref:Uncharacterized protein n=1 Tax=Riccia sorocarpa TaxID=122646 RepID=A0ABD3HTD2_9MARC
MADHLCDAQTVEDVASADVGVLLEKPLPVDVMTSPIQPARKTRVVSVSSMRSPLGFVVAKSLVRISKKLSPWVHGAGLSFHRTRLTIHWQLCGQPDSTFSERESEVEGGPVSEGHIQGPDVSLPTGVSSIPYKRVIGVIENVFRILQIQNMTQTGVSRVKTWMHMTTIQTGRNFKKRFALKTFHV